MKVETTHDRQSRFGVAGLWRAAFVAGVVTCVVACVVAPRAVLALPADPLRPFSAVTCDAALIRLQEALAGSPLVSAAENAKANAMARDQATRLCGADIVTKTVAGSDGPTVKAATGGDSVERSE